MTSLPTHSIGWSNAKVLEFVELLAAEPAIWNTRSKQHKFKHKVADAWVRIGEAMSVPINVLKAKKKSLMASFRPLVRKKKVSLRSGCSAEEVYRPSWFAYEAMESFLGSVYDVNKTINKDEDKVAGSVNGNDNETETPNEDETENAPSLFRVRSMQKKKNLGAQKQLTDRFETLNNILENKTTEQDEFEIFGQLLVAKLRKYPERMRHRMMYKIDGILLENPPPLAGNNFLENVSSEAPEICPANSLTEIKREPDDSFTSEDSNPTEPTKLPSPKKEETEEVHWDPKDVKIEVNEGMDVEIPPGLKREPNDSFTSETIEMMMLTAPKEETVEFAWNSKDVKLEVQDDMDIDSQRQNYDLKLT